MSINLEKAYFKKLEEYVGKKLNIVSNENEITIIYDVETSYVLQEEKEIFYFYCIQRNERIKIAEYYSEKEMETNFAIAIKGFFSEGIDYSGSEEIEGVVKLSDVNEIMKLHIGESYYSIMNPQKLKINLEEKGSNKYNIYLLGPNGECEYIEENEEAPFAKVRSLDSYKSRGIRGISEKLGAINSLNASSSYVFQAMIMIETMIANIDRGIREREYRINEIDCELGNYSEKIEKLKIRKRRLERE